ncbi:hypothetical protein D9M70_315360 [compost metagenome]
MTSSAFRERWAALADCSTWARSAGGMRSLNWGKVRALFIVVIPLAKDRLAPVEVAADALEVDDAAAADLHGGDGFGFNPAAHHVLGDLLPPCPASGRTPVGSRTERYGNR